MASEFRRKQSARLRKILTENDVSAVFFDKNEFLVEVISEGQLYKLGSVVCNKKVAGVVVDLEKTSLCINLNKEKIHINKRVLSEKNILDSATENLIKTGGSEVYDLVKEINLNNNFILSLVNHLKEKVDTIELNKIQINYGLHTDLPHFYSINVRNTKFNLYITKHQMSLITRSGFIKLHDTSRHTDSEAISRLIGDLFGVDKKELESVIKEHALTLTR